METQKKHVVKTGRGTVPFYNPPTRHYGQTPSEIIREARAAIMNPSPAGIKPLSTNRPFTPKEKERTLFGNVKKRYSRPPSSFSLSYLQRPEALPRVKLPAISTTSQKKIERNVNFHGVRSLDNLFEDCESEFVKYSISQLEDLPFFSESHSRSSERRAVRAATSNLPEKRSIYTVSQGYIDSLVSQPTDDVYYEYSEKSRKSNVDLHKRLGNANEYVTGSQSSSISELTGFAGKEKTISDNCETVIPCEKTLSSTKSHLLVQDHIKVANKGKKEAVSPQKEFENKLEKFESDKVESKKVTKTNQKSNKPKTPAANSEVDVVNKENSKPESSDFSCSPSNPGNEMSKEKSVATEAMSEYILSINRKPKDVVLENHPKPNEILELYETANYYEKNENPIEKSERRGGNAEKDSKEKNMLKHSDYLLIVKENIKNFDLKVKQLNESIDSFEEKLTGEKTVYLGSENEADKSNEGGFKMNTNVRHHVATERKRSVNKEYANDSNETKKESVGWDGFWKNSYYKQKGETESPASDQQYFSYEQILSRLLKINENASTDSNTEDIVRATSDMYKLLKQEEFLYKRGIEHETKIKILRCLYSFADNECPQILLNLARIVFKLKIENSLSAACKMVFKVARSDANDHLFLEVEDILELFLDGIGLASPLDEGECCIYGYGSLKFLTMNHRILSKLINLGVLDLLILHLKIISSAKTEGLGVKEQTQYALFQLTGALRNIAAGEGVLPLFITTNSIPVLCKILHSFRHCDDVVTNISRTLSLLSADEDVTQILMTVENVLGTLTELIEQYKTNEKILIRLSYCLGNIVAYNDLSRVQLARSESSVKTLLDILQLYVDKDLELFMKTKAEKKPDSDDNGNHTDLELVDDIIVKVIRIIANMCMNPVVGSNLSLNDSNDKNSLRLSRLLTTLLQRKDPGITLLASLGCLNNISYYCNNHSSLVDVTQGIVRVLGLHDEECKAEAARVLGNLTRHKEIRDLLWSTGGTDQLTKLLDTKNKDVYKSACGALVNLMLDHETRIGFVESHGIDNLGLTIDCIVAIMLQAYVPPTDSRAKDSGIFFRPCLLKEREGSVYFARRIREMRRILLIEGFEKFPGDWSFAGLICRAIWNSCADDMDRVTSYNDFEKLINILASSLEEENWNDGDPIWEEFACLATDLLEKINAHLELL